jgi:hypothetical protein
MTVLSISPRELERRCLARGAFLERNGAKHKVYRGPLGTFTISHGPRSAVTGRMVSTAARALGTTTKALLER